MMNRRYFLSTIAALFVAPKAAADATPELSEANRLGLAFFNDNFAPKTAREAEILFNSIRRSSIRHMPPMVIVQTPPTDSWVQHYLRASAQEVGQFIGVPESVFGASPNGGKHEALEHWLMDGLRQGAGDGTLTPYVKKPGKYGEVKGDLLR